MEWKKKLTDLLNEHNVHVNDVLDYWYEEQLINKPNRVKKSDYSYSWEFQAQQITKKYGGDLKKPDLDIDDKSHLFYGKKVVITGVFENFTFRKEMAKMVKKVGGDNDTDVTKRTDYLVAGEGAGWRKLQKADQYNVTIIKEEEFIKLFDGYN